MTHLDKLRPELILVLQVNVDEVPLADLTGDRVELAVVAGDDGQEPGQLVVDEVVVVDAVVEGVHDEAVEESALVLGLADDEGNLGEATLDKQVLGGVGQDLAVDGGGEPTREGEEHLKAKKNYSYSICHRHIQLIYTFTKNSLTKFE